MAKKASAAKPAAGSKKAPKVAGAQEVPKDEVALKRDSVEAGEGESTPVSSSKTKGKKASATEGVKMVDGLPASGGSGRKVRITEDSPAQAAKRRSSGAGTPDVAPANGKGKKSAKNGKVPSQDSEDAEMPAADNSTTSDPKFSPKHKDKARGLPEKSALKKQKKRKADDDAEEAETSAAAADESNVQEAETSMAALSTADEAEDGEVGEIDFLAGFESGSDEADEDGADSSDDEGAQPVSTKDLPEPKQSGKKAADSKKKAGKGKKSEPGVIYLGRVPHGFHEEEMQSYFSQFGDVNRLRLSRNRATGASKHYAFIEFAHSSVAQIVAETMDNYLLHGHILQCKIVPNEQVHPKLWIGAGRKFRPIPKGRVERLKHNAPKTAEQKDHIRTRLVKREEAKRAKLRDLGIEYDFDGYAKSLPSKQAKDEKELQKANKAAKKLEDQVKKDASDAEKKGKNGKAETKKEPARASKRARKSV